LASGAPEEALRRAQDAAVQARSAGDGLGVAEALCVVASAHIASGRAAEAEQLLSRELSSPSLLARTGDRAAEATLLWAFAGLKLAMGDFKEALRLASEGQALLQKRPADRKLQAQLLLAKANAHLAGRLAGSQGPTPVPFAVATLSAAGEALALCRQAGDKAGEGEVLHLVCLVYLLEGRQGAQLAAKKAMALASSDAEQPLGSLQASNEAAALLRQLGNKEGEATAMLCGVAEARIELGEADEAIGAARRAQEMFRHLGHRRGRQTALNVLARAQLMAGNTPAILDAVEEELQHLRTEGDVPGQLAGLRTLCDSYIAVQQYGEALSAARRSLAVVKESGSKVTEVRQLLLASELEDLLGRQEAALRSAQRALTLASTINASPGELAVEVRRTVSRLQTKCGRPELAPNRRDAMGALLDLAQAARQRDPARFHEVTARLEALSGYTDQDVKAALTGEDDPDREGLMRFLKEHGPGKSQAGGVKSTSQSMVLTGISNALLYLSFRVNGLAYGPRFRRCHPMRVEASEDGGYHSASYLRLLSSQDEWEMNMMTQPTLLDGMQHALSAAMM